MYPKYFWELQIYLLPKQFSPYWQFNSSMNSQDCQSILSKATTFSQHSNPTSNSHSNPLSSPNFPSPFHGAVEPASQTTHIASLPCQTPANSGSIRPPPPPHSIKGPGHDTSSSEREREESSPRTEPQLLGPRGGGRYRTSSGRFSSSASSSSSSCCDEICRSLLPTRRASSKAAPPVAVVATTACLRGLCSSPAHSRTRGLRGSSCCVLVQCLGGPGTLGRGTRDSREHIALRRTRTFEPDGLLLCGAATGLRLAVGERAC